MSSWLTVSVFVFTVYIDGYFGSYYRYKHANDNGWVSMNDNNEWIRFIDDWYNDDSWDKQKSIMIDNGYIIHMKCFSILNEESCACKSGATQPILECYDHVSSGIYHIISPFNIILYIIHSVTENLCFMNNPFQLFAFCGD